jgi:drug/metabolite transporter (DMT)-like permease
MNPVFLGSVSGLAWAIHDVIASRASKSVGAIKTATSVTVLGFLALTGWLAWTSGFPTGPSHWLWLPLAAGAGIALATIWLFAALAAGSLSLALPIVMSYPVTSLGLGALAGRHPSLAQLAAAAVTLGGMFIVTTSEPVGEPASPTRDAFRRTLTFGALAHLAYAASTFAAQYSATIFEPLGATWLSRIGGSLTILPLFFALTKPPRSIKTRWLPALAAMGCLDVLAIIMLNLAALTSYPELAVVAASSAGVISILLAWVIFRDVVGVKRWLGIVLTFAGVAMLAGLK